MFVCLNRCVIVFVCIRALMLRVFTCASDFVVFVCVSVFEHMCVCVFWPEANDSR